MQDFWAECDLIERVPGRCDGRPTIKGTRIEPDSIVADEGLGSTPEEIHESFPHLPLATIKGILDFRPQTSARSVKALLDESAPAQLRDHLAHHKTFTAVYAGFGAFENGALLKAAEDSGFDVLVTADKTFDTNRTWLDGNWRLSACRRIAGK